MKKVIVIGCPGSGKSVFSRALAAKSSLPLIHLDTLYHRDVWDDDPARRKTQWRAEVSELIQQDAWIMDGNYKSTLDIRVSAADTVVFLDYSRRLALFRAFRRHFSYRNKPRPDMPAGWKERMGRDVLRFIWDYRRAERPKVLALLSEYSQGRTILLFGRPSGADRFLDSL